MTDGHKSQTTKESCTCCDTGCSCGDCKECTPTTGSCGDCKDGCCDSKAGCCDSKNGCMCCARFRRCCLLCKIGKILFWGLVILALCKLAFGGWGMHGYMGGSCGMNQGSCISASGDQNTACAWPKGDRQRGGFRSSWFGRDDDDMGTGNLSGDIK